VVVAHARDQMGLWHLLDVYSANGQRRIRYEWPRRECDGMRLNQMNRINELEKEQLRPRKAVSHLTRDKMILQESAKGSF